MAGPCAAQDNCIYETDNVFVNADVDSDMEMIEIFDSDNEQNDSRWTGFVDSQSSEGTDYLNRPFPSKVEKRNSLTRNYENVIGQSEVNQALPSKFISDRKVAFNNRNRLQAQRNCSTLPNRNVRNDNKENTIWYAERVQKETSNPVLSNADRSNYKEHDRNIWGLAQCPYQAKNPALASRSEKDTPTSLVR